MSTTPTEDSMRWGDPDSRWPDSPQLFDAGPADPKRQLCGACRKGEHHDHHTGVWAKADGSDPVICDCSTCENANVILALLAKYRTKAEAQHATPVGTRGGSNPPLDKAEVDSLFAFTKSTEYRNVRKLILLLAFERGYYHGEQLTNETIEQRNMIGSAVGAMVSAGLLLEGDHRKGSNPASHGRRSYTYTLTPQGRVVAEALKVVG